MIECTAPVCPGREFVFDGNDELPQITVLSEKIDECYWTKTPEKTGDLLNPPAFNHKNIRLFALEGASSYLEKWAR